MRDRETIDTDAEQPEAVPFFIYFLLTGVYLVAALALTNIGYWLVTGADLVQL